MSVLANMNHARLQVTPRGLARRGRSNTPSQQNKQPRVLGTHHMSKSGLLFLFCRQQILHPSRDYMRVLEAVERPSSEKNAMFKHTLHVNIYHSDSCKGRTKLQSAVGGYCPTAGCMTPAASAFLAGTPRSCRNCTVSDVTRFSGCCSGLPPAATRAACITSLLARQPTSTCNHSSRAFHYLCATRISSLTFRTPVVRSVTIP